MKRNDANRGSEPVRLTRREQLATLGIWTTLGLIESAKAWLARRFSPQPVAWSTVLVGNMPWWLAWAALTPLILLLARRFRLDGGRISSWLVHLVAAVTLSVVHHAVVGALYYHTHTRGQVVPFAGELQTMTLALQFRMFFITYFLLNILTYVAVVSAYYGVEFYKRYRDGELRAARLEAGMHRARLAALHMELNPHFLFNTMNAIAGLVRLREHDAAVRMLARLSDLLRATLELGSDAEVPLDMELELLRTYLEIERIRFGERLVADVRADADAHSAMVPPLILQPLVENAVRHGIARHAGRGRVEVLATAIGSDLILSVTNTGPRDTATAEHTTGNAGIGLTNIRERLAELYGQRGSLVLERRPEGGATAVVRLPLRRADDDAEAAISG